MSERRREVMEAAYRVLRREGPHALTMRRVAAELGITAAGLYKHFLNRDDLVQALLERSREVLAGYLARAVTAATPTDRLVAAGEAYLQFALENEADFTLLFGSFADLPIALAPGPASISPNLRFLMNLVAACRPHATSEAALLELALEQWAVVHGLASLYLTGGGRQALSRAQFDAMSARILRRAAARVMPHTGS